MGKPDDAVVDRHAAKHGDTRSRQGHRLFDRLIRRTRAQITVTNRKGLETAAGDTYGVPEAMYRRLLH